MDLARNLTLVRQSIPEYYNLMLYEAFPPEK